MKSYFTNSVRELCELLVNAHKRLNNKFNDECVSLHIVAHYDLISNILTHLIRVSNFKIFSIDLHDVDVKGYEDAYILTITSDGYIFCEPAKNENGNYLSIGAGVCFIHSDVNSKFAISNADVTFVEFDVNDCDQRENTVTVNIENATELFNEIKLSLLHIDEIVEEMNNFRKILGW